MHDHVLIKPVSVWEGDAIRRTLIDVEGAANFLLLKWPKAFLDTAYHREAQIAALDALGGHGTAAAFREAFVAAAEEAGLFASSRVRSNQFWHVYMNGS